MAPVLPARSSRGETRPRPRGAARWLWDLVPRASPRSRGRSRRRAPPLPRQPPEGRRTRAESPSHGPRFVQPLKNRSTSSAGAPRQKAGGAQLGPRRADREGAAKVAREPDMEHLARALGEPRACRALSARRGLQSALLPLLADDMRVPAEDRAGRRGPDLAVPRAPHRADEDERPSRSVGVDQRLGAGEVEDRRAARLLMALRMEEEDASVAARARSGARVITRPGCRTYVSPTPSFSSCDEAVEDAAPPALAGAALRARPTGTEAGD